MTIPGLQIAHSGLLCAPGGTDKWINRAGRLYFACGSDYNHGIQLKPMPEQSKEIVICAGCVEDWKG